MPGRTARTVSAAATGVADGLVVGVAVAFGEEVVAGLGLAEPLPVGVALDAGVVGRDVAVAAAVLVAVGAVPFGST